MINRIQEALSGGRMKYFTAEMLYTKSVIEETVGKFSKRLIEAGADVASEKIREVKSVINMAEGAESTAAKSLNRIGRVGGAVALASAAFIGAATLLDEKTSLDRSREIDLQKAKAEKETTRKLNQKRNFVGYGLPGDPTVGVVQNMWNQRVGHSNIGNARFR